MAVGERHPRTLEAHRYHLERHLLPALGTRRLSALSVDDIAALLGDLRANGCSAKTAAGALATLHSIIRYARRHGWITLNPIDQLEPHERPRPARRRHRLLGREEIERLLVACRPRDRLMVATTLYTGLRISELLGLTWDDVDFDLGVIHVRAQLSRAHRGAPPRRARTKTEASLRDIPLVAQLADLLAEHRLRTPFAAGTDWVFVTANGTPHGERNVTRRGLQRAARIAGIDDGTGPALRYHDLRHTLASHLILDLGLDVAQVSRILGHASPTITLNVYTHLFDDARHTHEIRARMTASPFARLLEPTESTPVEMPMKLRHVRATVQQLRTAGGAGPRRRPARGRGARRAAGRGSRPAFVLARVCIDGGSPWPPLSDWGSAIAGGGAAGLLLARIGRVASSGPIQLPARALVVALRASRARQKSRRSDDVLARANQGRSYLLRLSGLMFS